MCGVKKKSGIGCMRAGFDDLVSHLYSWMNAYTTKSNRGDTYPANPDGTNCCAARSVSVSCSLGRVTKTLSGSESEC